MMNEQTENQSKTQYECKRCGDPHFNNDSVNCSECGYTKEEIAYQKESVEVIEEETNEYEGATLEEKVESLAFWMNDALDSLLKVVKEIKKDHYESEGDSLDCQLDSVEDAIEQIGLVRNTLEAI